MNIDFLINACIEYQDTFTLIYTLKKFKKLEDNILVVLDSDNTNDNMVNMIKSFNIDPKFIPLGNFNTQFESQRQYWTKNLVMILCPDEIISYVTIQIIRNAFQTNLLMDALAIPRINFFLDATEDRLSNMYLGNRDKNDYIDMQNKHSEGWQNWPDYQIRVFKPEPYIHYGPTIHSSICGYKNLGLLPADPSLALVHIKTMEHQERMLKLYDTLEPQYSSR